MQRKSRLRKLLQGNHDLRDKNNARAVAKMDAGWIAPVIRAQARIKIRSLIKPKYATAVSIWNS